jgi:serine/threonine protein kinase
MSESAVYRNALAAGISLNEYRLESVLGAGGFGITYLARDVHLDKPVAIKEYLPGDLALRALDGSVVPVSTGHRTDYQWGLDRFIQEARTLARFSHPHIVHVNRYFELNDTGYMVMDYEEGESLHARLKRAPLPAEDELRGLLLPLLDGLAAVHAANFLHRDIKPANIFIRRDGRPVLLDFGAGRATGGATRSLTAEPTPGYAPLEQYSPDGKQGPWSDLYALAGVVFRMVTDRNPPDAVGRLQADTVAAALQAARRRYSPPLINAVDWALSVKAELRPQTVAHWRAVLEGAPRMAPAVTTTPATLAAPALPAAPTAAASRPHTMPPVTRVSTTRTVPVAADHSESWRRVGWTLFWVIAAIVATGWYLKRKPEPPPPPPAVAAPSAKRAPVQVEVVETPALAVLPAAPAIAAVAPAPAADIVVVKPVEPPPGRVPERVADEFRGADRNNDGYLAPAEVEGLFPFIAKEFNKVDRDGDRRISLDEFAELRRQQFERKPLQK